MHEKSQSEPTEVPPPPPPSLTNAKEVPRTGHSMPTVVTKSTQPSDVFSRKENQEASGDGNETATTKSAEANVTADANAESLPTTNEHDSVRDELSSADPDVIDKSGQKPEAEGPTEVTAEPEPDLDEDELLKLINE